MLNRTYFRLRLRLQEGCAHRALEDNANLEWPATTGHVDETMGERRALLGLFRQRVQRLAQDALSQLLLLIWRQVRVAQRMDDAVSLDDPVGAYHLRDRYH